MPTDYWRQSFDDHVLRQWGVPKASYGLAEDVLDEYVNLSPYEAAMIFGESHDLAKRK